MADLVRHAVGVDLVEIALRLALGDAVPDELVEPAFQQPLAIRFLTAEPGPLPTGTVTRIGELEPVLACEGVVQADTYLQVGETIRPVRARRRPARLRDRDRGDVHRRRSPGPRRRRPASRSRSMTDSRVELVARGVRRDRRPVRGLAGRDRGRPDRSLRGRPRPPAASGRPRARARLRRTARPPRGRCRRATGSPPSTSRQPRSSARGGPRPGATVIASETCSRSGCEPGSFDAVCSFYALNHVPRERLGELLDAHRRSGSTPDGLLLASFGTGDLEAWTGSWLGTETFFSSWDARGQPLARRRRGPRDRLATSSSRSSRASPSPGR